MRTLGIASDDGNWHMQFCKFATELMPAELTIKQLNLQRSDWIEQLSDVDIVIWRPTHMGVEAASYFKEKIYFMETFLNKKVFPSYSTVWHFESKVAQHYLFELFSVETPSTLVTFDPEEAERLVDKLTYPIIFKKSSGAGSRNVKLIKSRRQLIGLISRVLSRNILKKYWHHNKFKAIRLANLFSYLVDRFICGNNMRSLYLQEFIPGNHGDIRITVIGQKFAFGYRRKNRKNDFRASGSGIIDYSTPIPIEFIKYCVDLSRKFKFDSMAYDLVVKDRKPKIIEMSYGFIDKYIIGCHGYWSFEQNEFKFNPGSFTPQEMWVRSVLES